MYTVDAVNFLTEGNKEIVSPEEMVLLAQNAGFPFELNLIEYGQSITELVVRRMLLNAKMTFLAAYEYYTYSFNGGFMVVENPNDVNGYHTKGTQLEATVDVAYAHLVRLLS